MTEKVKTYVIIHLYQLLIVYVSLSSLGGNIDNDANVTLVLGKADVVSVNIFGSKLIDRSSLLRTTSFCL